MNLETLQTEEIKGYIQAEQAKGRSMREIVKEIAAARDDFTVLSHNSEIAQQQILDVLQK